jgi:hypothetical protein
MALISVSGTKVPHARAGKSGQLPAGPVGARWWRKARQIIPPRAITAPIAVYLLLVGLYSIVSSWKFVEPERRFVALDVHLQHAVDRLPNLSQLVERAAKKLLLPHPIDARDDDDQTSV